MDIWEEIDRIVSGKDWEQLAANYKTAINKGDWFEAHNLLLELFKENKECVDRSINLQDEIINHKDEAYTMLSDYFVNVRNSYIHDIKIIRGAISSMRGKRAERDAFIKDLLANLCKPEYAETRSRETWFKKRGKQ